VFDLVQTAKAGPASYRTLTRGRVSKLVVNANNVNDPLGIALRGIRSVVSFQSQGSKAVEFANIGTHPCESYSGLDQRSIERCLDGFFLDASVIHNIRDCFEGTDEYIIMGGAVFRELRRAFSGVAAIKLCGLDDQVTNLFGDEDGLRAMYEHRRVDIMSMNLQTDGQLNFHFCADAVYPHLGSFIDIEDTGERIIEHRFSSWKDLYNWLSRAGNLEKMQKALFEQMPFLDYLFLKDSGLDICGYADGKPIKTRLSKGRDCRSRINIYYWSSTSKMEEHFSK
jgi:hypothetical protein